MIDPEVIARLKKPRLTSEFEGAFAHVALDDLNALLHAYEVLLEKTTYGGFVDDMGCLDDWEY